MKPNIKSKYILTFIVLSQAWLIASQFVPMARGIFMILIGLFWVGGAYVVMRI